MVKKYLVPALFGIAILLTTLYGGSFVADDYVQVPPAPYWGSSQIWSMDITANITQQVYNFTYYYDWTKKLETFAMQAGPGQVQEMCRASGYANWQGKQCNVIHAADAWWYIQFPTENFCCKCTNKFGMVRYDWLQ